MHKQFLVLEAKKIANNPSTKEVWKTTIKTDYSCIKSISRKKTKERCKKEKEGQVTEGEYEQVAQACRDCVRKTNMQDELGLTRNV